MSERLNATEPYEARSAQGPSLHDAVAALAAPAASPEEHDD